jgi:hypothetical protein
MANGDKSVIELEEDTNFKHLSWVGDSERATLMKQPKQNVKALAVPSAPATRK